MDFGRVLTAMITPMYDNGDVNFDEAQKIAAYLLDHGSDGLVVTGTTGEGATLNASEKLKLYAEVMAVAHPRKAPVIAGTSSNVTRDTVELSLKAEALGVDGILAVTPYYNKPPQASMAAHFAALDQALRIPIMLYNVPSRTNNNLAPATLAGLAKLPHIHSIKEATGDMEQMTLYRALTPPDFQIYSGEDSVTFPMACLGASGVVSVAGHIIGEQIREMLIAVEQGRLEDARELHFRYFDACKKLFVTTNPMPVKYAMGRIGFKVGPCRLPLTWVDDQQAAAIDAMLADIGLI